VPLPLNSCLVAAGLLLTLACGPGAPPAATQANPAAQPASKAAKATPPTTAPPPVASRDASPTTPEPAGPTYAEAGGMMYLEQIIGEAGPDEPLPMLVAIHGLGDRPEAFARVLSAFPEPVRLILPRGIDAYEGGWSWFPQRARSRDVEALGGGIQHAADVIATGLTALAAERPTKGKPVLTGFSQGGMLTFAIAVSHPDVVGYAVPVSGWLPPPLWPENGDTAAVTPKIVALHGTTDSAVLYEGTVEAVDQLKTLGYAAELRTFEGVPHAIPPIVLRAWTDLLKDAVIRAKRSQ